jgi:hypothetical protein
MEGVFSISSLNNLVGLCWLIRGRKVRNGVCSFECGFCTYARTCCRAGVSFLVRQKKRERERRMKRKEHHPSASTSHSLWYSGFKFDFPGMDISPGTRALISALQAHEDGEEEKKKNPLLLNGLGDLASPTGPASTEPTREHNTFPPSLPATHKIALLQHYTPTHAFTNQQCV